MNRPAYLLFLLLVVAALAGAPGAGAQTSPGHDLSWHVVAAGGAPMASAGAVHRVNGTLGQLAIGPAAGPAHAAGLGYWYGLLWETGFKVYLPLVTRGG